MESINIDHDLTDFTANKISSRPTSALCKANRTKGTRIKNKKTLQEKSQLSARAATKMLVSQPLVVKNSTDGKTIGLLYTSSKQQPKNSNLKASMAMTYEHYFSKIPCPQPKDQSALTDLITYHTYQVTKRLLKELIRAPIDGGANGGIGGRDMAIIA